MDDENSFPLDPGIRAKLAALSEQGDALTLAVAGWVADCRLVLDVHNQHVARFDLPEEEVEALSVLSGAQELPRLARAIAEAAEAILAPSEVDPPGAPGPRL